MCCVKIGNFTGEPFDILVDVGDIIFYAVDIPLGFKSERSLFGYFLTLLLEPQLYFFDGRVEHF